MWYLGELGDLFVGPIADAGAGATPYVPSARTTPWSSSQVDEYKAVLASGKPAKNPATGQWEYPKGTKPAMTQVDWMQGQNAFYGTGAKSGAAGRSSAQGPDQDDPTAFYGQQVSLDAGVMSLQSEMAARSISRDFERIMSSQPGYYGGSSPALPPTPIIPEPSAQPSLPTYTPSSDSSRTDIGIEEAQVPMQAVATPSKTGVDSKWLIAAAVIGVFLALRK